LAKTLTACPGAVLTITGHTDARGDADANQRLSEARAVAVGQFLIANGVAPSRISTRGVGEAEPIADNNTAAGRARNRRIEMTLEEMEQ
jgi:OOP family OmpA-OmpF porin